MSENLLERLCNSRRRWLIVTGVTFVIALASILPQVDLLLAERSERAELQAQLAHARQMADELPLYEQRVEQKTAELDELRLLEVDESEIADLRSWLVDAAREAGCQVRRIDLVVPNRTRLDRRRKPARAGATTQEQEERLALPSGHQDDHVLGDRFDHRGAVVAEDARRRPPTETRQLGRPEAAETQLERATTRPVAVVLRPRPQGRSHLRRCWMRSVKEDLCDC